jgi:hypothetical protein
MATGRQNHRLVFLDADALRRLIASLFPNPRNSAMAGNCDLRGVAYLDSQL